MLFAGQAYLYSVCVRRVVLRGCGAERHVGPSPVGPTPKDAETLKQGTFQTTQTSLTNKIIRIFLYYENFTILRAIRT